jgi:tetratricopeptide (TPR) repeat protein
LAKKKRGQSRQARRKAHKAASDPIRRGQESFHRGDYDSTIATWEKAYQENASAALGTALAEVYFRRGLVQFHRQRQHASGLADLEQAARLAPGDPRYAYHLGLAHHHQADLDTAIAAYRLALDSDPGFVRAAELTVLALLERGKDPVQDVIWKALPADRQAALGLLVALVRGDSFHLVEPTPAPTGLALLWQGLAAMQSGDDRAPVSLRTIAQDDAQPAPARALAACALGLVALRHAQLAEAQAHWESARRLGLDTPALRSNLGFLYGARAEEAMACGQWADAAALADAAVDMLPSAPDSRDLATAAHLHAGYAAAQAGRWNQARDEWEQARNLGENSRAFVQNLALAHEKTEQFLEAAELWREVVRRRPRKSHAPDALTPQQVALLWGHVADCYRRAGNAEEAIATLRNAVKNDPGDADLRLQLADALVADERWWAAGNEVARVLKREPKNVGALVRSARIDEGDGYLARARTTWKKVVGLDPKHVEARERLAELLSQEGDRLVWLDRPGEALKRYREALEYTPDDPQLYICVADCHLRQDDPAAAHQELGHAFALDPADLGIYHAAVDMCHVAHRPDDAEWVIAQAEQLGAPHHHDSRLPATFYLDIAHCCFKRHQTQPAEDYLRRAEERAEGDPDALVEIGGFYLDRQDTERAIICFDRALRLDPEHGWANFQVGASYAAAFNMKEANRYWRQARRTARRTGDQELLEAVEETRQLFSGALDRLMSGLEPIGLFDDADDDESW